MNRPALSVIEGGAQIIDFPSARTTEPWVRKAEVARHLGMSVRWIEDRMRHDDLPHAHHGRAVRFRLSEVDRWMASRRAS